MARRATLDVSLPPRLRKLVETEVKSGRYDSASDVVRAGLRLFERNRDWDAGELAWLRREIQEGIDELDRGESVDGETAKAELRAELHRRRDGDAIREHSPAACHKRPQR